MPYSTPHRAYAADDTPPPARGRLILVLERTLSEASRMSLRKLLGSFVDTSEVTMVSGLSRASILQADAMGNGVFYNRREYIAPETAVSMMPWREVWVVAGAMVWMLQPQAH